MKTKTYRTKRGSIPVTRWSGVGSLLIAMLLLIGCIGQTEPMVQDVKFNTPEVAGQDKLGKPIDSALNPAYRVGPEDKLHISVWKEPDLDREVLVRPDGGISFPLAGNLQAAGKTTQQLTTELTRKIQRYIPDAVVTVTVVEVAGYDIFVVGKVKNPGQFTIGQYIDVLQALTLAGGLTPFASENNIKIQRRGVDGRVIVFPFQYSDVKKGRKLHQNIILQSGDTVVVP